MNKRMRIFISCFVLVCVISLLLVFGLVSPLRVSAQSGCSVYDSEWDGDFYRVEIDGGNYFLFDASDWVHAYTIDDTWLGDLFVGDEFSQSNVSGSPDYYLISDGAFSLDSPAHCSSWTPTPDFTATPDTTSTPAPTVTPPPTYTPTYCDSDFETCYGDGLGKFLLLFLALFAVFVVGARQRVLLGIAIIFFALLAMPLDVFAFWFFLATVLLLLADMLLASSS